jgi:hypothetical protein
MGIRVFRTLSALPLGIQQAEEYLTRTKAAFFSTPPLDLM